MLENYWIYTCLIKLGYPVNTKSLSPKVELSTLKYQVLCWRASHSRLREPWYVYHYKKNIPSILYTAFILYLNLRDYAAFSLWSKIITIQPLVNVTLVCLCICLWLSWKSKKGIHWNVGFDRSCLSVLEDFTVCLTTLNMDVYIFLYAHRITLSEEIELGMFFKETETCCCNCLIGDWNIQIDTQVNTYKMKILADNKKEHNV